MGTSGKDDRGAPGAPVRVEDRDWRVKSWVGFAQSKEDSMLGRRPCWSKDLYEKVFGVSPGRHLKTESECGKLSRPNGASLPPHKHLLFIFRASPTTWLPTSSSQLEGETAREGIINMSR